MDESCLETPYYLIDIEKLESNLRILKNLKDESGCKVLLAQKAFSLYGLYPLISSYLDGVASSGLYEAKLGREEFDGEVHVFSAAYKEGEMEELIACADHIVFNSINQVEKFADYVHGCDVECGLRLNPEISTQDVPLYDPCMPGSRFGVRLRDFKESILDQIDGFHMHTLCMQNSDDLKVTVDELENKFGKYLSEVEWINLGGGHHITREDYDIPLLIKIITHLVDEYSLKVYLEPGEAVVLNCGEYVSTVLDVVNADIPIAILDGSATCHMPDVIEMPFTPPIATSDSGIYPKSAVRLAGCTCLAGDIMGTYDLEAIPKAGDRIRFQNMALYTMVKNNTFNGMPLPSIFVKGKGSEVELYRDFGYSFFKDKL